MVPAGDALLVRNLECFSMGFWTASETRRRNWNYRFAVFPSARGALNRKMSDSCSAKGGKGSRGQFGSTGSKRINK
jgi:hypothetical protein